MISNFKHIAVRDTPFVQWSFFLPINEREGVKKNKLEELKLNIVNFHIDYILLSQKYGLCELLPQTFLTEKKISNYELLNSYIKEIIRTIDNNRYLFFGYDNTPVIRNHEIQLRPSSCRLNLVDDIRQINDYFKYNRTNKTVYLENEEKLTSYSSNEILEIKTGEILYLENNPYSVDEISFELETCSEFWFQKTCYTEGRDYLNGIDNSILAFNNTPRLNSFIRDLKKLWIKKYHGKVEVTHSWKDITTEEGILLDGKIIYQEDTDKGQIDLSNLW